ncbi:unnamed protein product [Lactuca virosa]|uniref:Uncharacterized protein n=1 Tax=Lactuca virosa TaxID=75947 RepID=A0AAU9MPI5_9ASTR|nr:unnamed protein product [Lactuca virosa]
MSALFSMVDRRTHPWLSPKSYVKNRPVDFTNFGDSDEDDFRFSLDLSEEGVSAKEIDSRGWTIFPLFNRDLLIKDEVKSKDNEIHASDSIISSLRKLFIDEPKESSSCSSSEADELEALPSGTFCVWRPKTESGSSPVMRVE